MNFEDIENQSFKVYGNSKVFIEISYNYLDYYEFWTTF